MTPQPPPLPTDFALRAFLCDDALTAGIPLTRLNRKDLVAPTAGVRMPRELADDPIEVIRAITMVLREDQRVSGISALLLYGCPLPERCTDPGSDVQVVTSGPGAITRRRGIDSYRARKGSRTRVVDGIRASTPADAWFEARTRLTAEELVVVGDHLVGTSGLATIDDLRATTQIGGGVRLVAHARAALQKIRVGSESPMETRFRLVVLDAGFPEPELNVDVRGCYDEFLGRVDLVWPEYKIGLEYDGAHHRTDRRTWENDRRRENGFAVSSDWTIVHASAQDVADPKFVLGRLRQAFASRVRWMQQTRIEREHDESMYGPEIVERPERYVDEWEIPVDPEARRRGRDVF
jgi:hypothetical protein